MSDSSEDEDLSRFREAVDNSFVTNLTKPKITVEDGVDSKVKPKPKSERYLEEASHYNDVKVPRELQKRIGAKVSAIIEKNIKFVEVESNIISEPQILGGVKLFRNSGGFLSCDAAADTYTEKHNAESRKLKKRKKINTEEVEIAECDKVCAVAVSGEYVLSKKETKCWKSRRKEKVFKYKSNGKSKLLTSLDQ